MFLQRAASVQGGPWLYTDVPVASAKMLPVNKNLQNFSPLTYIPGCGKRTSSLQFGNKFLRKEAHLVFTVKSLEAVKPGKRARVERGLYVEVSKDGTSRRFLFRFVSPATHRPT